MNLLEKLWSDFKDTGFFEFLENSVESITNVIASVMELESRINCVTMQDNIYISQWVGMVRYFVGDVMYTAIIITLWLGIAFAIYKCVIVLWEAINNALVIDLSKFKIG